MIFLRQLIAQAGRGDVAVAISTSGGSRNVIAALEEARKRGLLTVALLGYDGGEIVRRGLADLPIVVRSDYIPRIQEVQASIYHVMREALEAMPDMATSLSCSARASCPYTGEMREWLEVGRARVRGVRRGERSGGARADAGTGRRPARRAGAGRGRRVSADRLAGATAASV